LKTPGFGVPGALSIACFVLILVGKYFAGLAEVPHLVAVGAGVVLLIVELFVLPGTIWFGVGGLVLIVGGLVLSGGDAELALTEPFARDHLISGTFQVLAATVAALVVSMVVSRLLPRAPGVRRVVLAHAAAAQPGEAVGESRIGQGTVGTALTDLRPVGKVRFGTQDEHEARSEGPLVKGGARVVVVSNDMGRLVVREVAS
jgi:membrane-bound serine protease (ClpP class)